MADVVDIQKNAIVHACEEDEPKHRFKTVDHAYIGMNCVTLGACRVAGNTITRDVCEAPGLYLHSLTLSVHDGRDVYTCGGSSYLITYYKPELLRPETC